MIKKVLFISVIFLFLGIAVFFGMTNKPLLDVAAQLEQAEAYVDNSEYEQAEAIYKTIIQDYPGTDDALEAQKNLVMLYITWGKQPEAEAAFQELVTDFSDHNDIAEAFHGIADRYAQLQQYEKANQLFQYVLENWPQAEHAIWAQAGLAMSNIALADNPQAQVAIEKLLTEFSEHKDVAGALNEIADSYRASEQYEKANQLFQYVLDNWPDSEYAMWSQAGLVRSNFALGETETAEAAFEKLVTEFSEHKDIADAVNETADKYFSLGEYEKAREVFQYVLENWPQAEHTIWAQAGLVRSNFALGDDATAQAAFEELLTDFSGHPDIAKAVYDIAHIYHRELQQYEKANQLFQYALDNWPDDENAGNAQFLIGNYYERLRYAGLIPESEANQVIEQAYREVVEKYPASLAVRGASLKLGWLNFRRGQWLEAAQYFELSLKKSREDRKPVHILYPLGRAYEEIGKLDKAVQVYEDFIESVPSFDPRVETVKARLEQLALIK